MAPMSGPRLVEGLYRELEALTLGTIALLLLHDDVPSARSRRRQ